MSVVQGLAFAAILAPIAFGAHKGPAPLAFDPSKL
jgi:hypothetical protein